MQSPCPDVRLSLSAHVDGEEAPLSIDQVDAHVVTCADCTAFAAGLPLLQERVAAMRAVPVADGTAAVLAGAAARREGGPTSEQLRWLLGLAAFVQFVVAVTALAGVGGDHVARDLATFELAVAGGLASVAWRPGLAAGLLPFVGVAAAIGLVTMVGDAVAGTTAIGTELAHLVLVVATWPLAALARRTAPTGTVASR